MLDYSKCLFIWFDWVAGDGEKCGELGVSGLSARMHRDSRAISVPVRAPVSQAPRGAKRQKWQGASSIPYDFSSLPIAAAPIATDVLSSPFPHANTFMSRGSSSVLSQIVSAEDFTILWPRGPGCCGPLHLCSSSSSSFSSSSSSVICSSIFRPPSCYDVACD